MSALARGAWPAESLGEVIAATARAAGLAADASSPGRPPTDLVAPDGRAETAWIEAACEAMRIEAEAVSCPCSGLASDLARIAPAVLRVGVGGSWCYVGVVASRDGSVDLVTPSLTRERVSTDDLARALTLPVGADVLPFVDRWMQLAGVAPRRAIRAREKLLALALEDQVVSGIWLLRDDPGAPFVGQVRRRGFGRLTLRILGLSILQSVLTLGSWAILGRWALQGVVETGWLYAWLLVSVAGLPLQVGVSYLGGRLSLETAEILKRRLLCGALRMAPGDVRARGSGGLLATVTESEAVEAAALGGAFGALGAVVQLVGAAAVLSLGASGSVLVTLLAVWCAILVAAVTVLMKRRLAWTQERFGLSNAIVENIIGHRTRLAQEPSADHHLREDAALDRYVRASEWMDGLQTSLAGLPSRGWLVLAVLGLTPSILHAGGDHKAILVAIGGILQAQGGIATLLGSVTSLLSLVGSWRSIGPLFDAAAHRDIAGSPTAAVAREPRGEANRRDERAGVVLEARGLTYRYASAPEPVLAACDLVLEHGDRVLLEGRSGGGKSTLAGVLSGTHVPQSGFLAVRGLDPRTLGGTRWRQRVASAPQFHENHILSGSLGFNLLMGRAWPPSSQDLAEAEALCRELGLGDLIGRMPSGLSQVVGETGWQLSHGERSRIFLARALLQKGDVTILDESFGALDPVTLRQCLACVHARADALVVIAHP